MTTNHPDPNKNIEKLLKQLPKIENTQEKDALYRKIQAEINNSEPKSKNKKRLFLPVFTIIGCLIILLITWNGMGGFSFYTGSDIDTRQESTTDSSKVSEMQKAQIMEDASIEQNTLKENTEESSQELLPPVKDQSLFQYADEDSFVYRTDNPDNQNIIYTSWATEDVQYVLPISFINTDVPANDVTNFNVRVEEYVSLEANGLFNLEFDKLEININQDEKRAEIQIDNAYPVYSSSGNYQMFRYMLSDMLVPLGIEQVVLNGNHPFIEQQNNFSPQYRTNTLYKIYQFQDDSPFWLIPIPANYQVQSFSDALEEMKKDEEAFHVTAVIPPEAEIEISDNGDLVNVAITSSLFGNNQGTVTMIEAILLTAKSYGYEQVRFDIGINQAGNYQLTEPVDIPDIINPVYGEQ
ncbi:hypothetical protein F9U64_05020 [Gracilibacillus oryzae]|uniref:GerMN domain-containing protein n=1 Tax=Gracilibacillus oryzae TaxID=1672701 RepID=A0A7C8GUD7_9BACI|nr:hypothetical protein [Gracilibacillus oryzae]KAB8138367.1 hypothetical protein F9U64_05020 [Gracilibacillus oryzae]